MGDLRHKLFERVNTRIVFYIFEFDFVYECIYPVLGFAKVHVDSLLILMFRD